MVERLDFLAAQEDEWIRYVSRARDAGAETLCGPGSTVDFTLALRDMLPEIFDLHDIRSILDAPCGDGQWMKHIDLTGINYTGWDNNETVLALAKKRIPAGKFRKTNLLTRKRIPNVDLIICRDFLAHIPDEFVLGLLSRFKTSGSRYLLATNFPGNNDHLHSYDRDGFYYRPVNLTAEPFNMPAPLKTLAEPGPEVGRQMALFALQ